LPNKKGKVDASVHPRAGPSNRQLWTCCRRAARGRDLVLSRREPLPTMLVPPAPPNQATRGRGLPRAAFALYRHDHAPPVWQMARSSTFGARGRLPVLPIPPTGRWSAGCEGDDDHGPLVYWPASITTGSSLPRLHHTGGELNEEPRQTSSQLCPDLVPTASCTRGCCTVYRRSTPCRPPDLDERGVKMQAGAPADARQVAATACGHITTSLRVPVTP
jgi:hypothetical protein